MNNKRDALRQYLIDNGIECGVHYYPGHLLSYYGKSSSHHLSGGYISRPMPVTEKVYNELLTLPLHPEVSEEDLDYIVTKIKEFFR